MATIIDLVSRRILPIADDLVRFTVGDRIVMAGDERGRILDTIVERVGDGPPTVQLLVQMDSGYRRLVSPMQANPEQPDARRTPPDPAPAAPAAAGVRPSSLASAIERAHAAEAAARPFGGDGATP